MLVRLYIYVTYPCVYRNMESVIRHFRTQDYSMSDKCGKHAGRGVESSVDVDALAKCLNRRLTEVDNKLATSKQASIWKVPKLLRGNELEAYEPKILSLGPYHHDKQQPVMNQLKLFCLKRFLGRNHKISLCQYLEKIKERESDVRLAYSEDCGMESKNLVEMLLLDCCFVLEIMWFYKEKSNLVKPHDEKKDGKLMNTDNPFVSTRYSAEVMVRDMLLLENQLPFFLIRHLFDSAYHKPDECLENLIITFFKTMITLPIPSIPGKKASSTGDASSSGDFLHILDIVHSSISPKNVDHKERRKRACCLDERVHWIPCAAELRNAGIRFVSKDDKEKHCWWKLWNRKCSPRPCSFLDITFEEGRMKIPKLKVEDDTETILRNLIAFEQCYIEAKPHVTAYAILMDHIINTEADVELLQQSDVLVNGLGDSKEVATLFNKLCTELTMPDECYSGVYNDIDRHIKTQCNRWRAKLNHDYLSNPWALISVIAACLLFVLTITQTVFSVLSYINDKSA